MEKRTTLIYRGEEYPFYKTNRGNVNFHDAGFTIAQLASGNTRVMLALLYYHLVDCAKRAGRPITDSFETFIDHSEPDVLDAFDRLESGDDAGNGQTPEPGQQPEPENTASMTK